MLALLSPAKNLDLSPPPFAFDAEAPALMKDTESLMKTTRRLSQKKIRELMKLSPELAKLNYDRYRAFELPMTPENSMPAVMSFAGDVYRGLDARSLSEEQLRWAQEHVAILSGLYGLMRPMDLMQPYRLEMGTRLETRRGANLYSFWGDKIRSHIETRLQEHEERTLVNLASNEYFKATQPKKLSVPVVACVFEDYKTDRDEGKVISFMAKQARGKMTRWIVEQALDRPEGLKDFKVDRYRYYAKRSTPDRLVFVRKFIPVKK